MNDQEGQPTGPADGPIDPVIPAGTTFADEDEEWQDALHAPGMATTGVQGYRRIQEHPTGRGPFSAIVGNELYQLFQSLWGRLAVLGIAVYAITYIGSVYTSFQGGSTTVHSLDTFLDFADFTRWFVLVVAAVMGPSLLEDQRTGALELYRSRPASRGGYLAAKATALTGAMLVTYLGALLLYVAASYFLFDNHPDDWHLVPWRSILYALLWTVPMAGLAMGLSCLSRSSRAASLFLFGGVFVLDVIVTNLLSGITNSERPQAISPLAQHASQAEWVFGTEATQAFPSWWGLAALLGLAVLGWILVAWRHPRLPGEVEA